MSLVGHGRHTCGATVLGPERWQGLSHEEGSVLAGTFWGVSGAVPGLGAGSYWCLCWVQGQRGLYWDVCARSQQSLWRGHWFRGHPGLCHGTHTGCCQGLCWGSRFRVNGIRARLEHKWELAGPVWGRFLPRACFRGHCSLQAGSLWDTAASAREWHCGSGISEARSGALTPSHSHSSVLSQLLPVATASPQSSTCP